MNMTEKQIGINKELTRKTVKDLSEKPKKIKGDQYAFPDGIVVEARSLGEAQEKREIIIKKNLKIINK